MDFYKRTCVCTYNTNIKLLMGIIIRALRERRKRVFGSFVMYDPPPSVLLLLLHALWDQQSFVN